MWRRVLVLVLAMLVVAGVPATVLGASTLDQQQTTYDGFSGNSTQCIAQTFTAGMSGHLDHVSVYVRKLTDHPIMRIEIHDTQPSGEPGVTVLATQDVAGSDIASTFGWIDFEFATPPLVVAGTSYAIVAPPLGPMGPDPNPWGFEWGGAQESVSVDPYPDGRFYSANACVGPYGTQSADLAFKTFVDMEGVFQPDGAIRVNFGGWAGGNVYNGTGDGQSRTGSARRGDLVLFRIGIQNDGIVRDRFTVDANGTSAPGYRVRYFHRTREITDAVRAGTYVTRWLDPGERTTIEAWVKVRLDAAAGSEVTRLVSITSEGDPTKLDAVEFVAMRK